MAKSVYVAWSIYVWALISFTIVNAAQEVVFSSASAPGATTSCPKNEMMRYDYIPWLVFVASCLVGYLLAGEAVNIPDGEFYNIQDTSVAVKSGTSFLIVAQPAVAIILTGSVAVNLCTFFKSVHITIMSCLIAAIAAMGPAILKLRLPPNIMVTKNQMFWSTVVSMSAFWMFITETIVLMIALYQADAISLTWFIMTTIVLMIVAVTVSRAEMHRIRNAPKSLPENAVDNELCLQDTPSDEELLLKSVQDLIDDHLLTAIAHAEMMVRLTDNGSTVPVARNYQRCLDDLYLFLFGTALPLNQQPTPTWAFRFKYPIPNLTESLEPRIAQLFRNVHQSMGYQGNLIFEWHFRGYLEALGHLPLNF